MKKIRKESWDYFRNTGLVFLVNNILHAFGWAIVFEVDKEGSVNRVYPARTSYRGFPENLVEHEYKKIATYIYSNSEKILDETFSGKLK